MKEVYESIFISQVHRHQPSNLCSKLLDSSIDSRRVRTANSQFTEALAALEESKSRHRRDAEVGSDSTELVNVDLVELEGDVLVAELLDGGGDGLAGTTPRGEEVDDDAVVGFQDLPLELVGTVKEYKLEWFFNSMVWIMSSKCFK